jgi:hypothetical protein
MRHCILRRNCLKLLKADTDHSKVKLDEIRRIVRKHDICDTTARVARRGPLDGAVGYNIEFVDIEFVARGGPAVVPIHAVASS